VALQLMTHGWKSVHPLYGGFDAWQQAGYAVEPKE
jgi:3-mercaptopyruvate sulfurtransferase SseA